MIVQIDILNLIILVVVIVIAAFLLPLIWQLKKTAQETDALLHDLRRELIPSLQDFREITERINRASVKTENIAENAACLILGIRAASKVFFKETQEKGE